MSVAEATREKLMQDVTQVVSDTEQLLKTVGTAGNEKAQTLRTGIEDNLRSAKARMKEMQQGALQTGREAVRATDEYVHSHPWQSVAWAAGAGAVAGLVIGLLLNRDR